MMKCCNNIIECATRLLQEGQVDWILGYEQGTKSTRPCFCRTVEEASRLVFDEALCTHNLAVYLTRKDLFAEKKRIAVTAPLSGLQGIARLYAEHQLEGLDLTLLTLFEGEVKMFKGNDDGLKTFLKANQRKPKKEALEQLSRVEAMTREERWAFWTASLSKCIRCYACRAACPLCYCTQCIVEVNRPQWIDTWSAPLSNLEWQLNRVMHMAGRCIGCGACANACPLHLPIHLLTMHLQRTVRQEFGESTDANVLSSFNTNDKEDFIR